MIALSVNLNKVALVRNSRSGNFPDVLAFARLCMDAGARGITVHPRPDQRHIRASDIAPLRSLVLQQRDIEFNIEGNPFAGRHGSYPGFMELVLQSPPHQCTLVPDADNQLTSDHGFDLSVDGKHLAPLIRQLKTAGIRVSLFMDPVIDQVNRAAELGADRIELYTGPFAEAFLHGGEPAAQEIFAQHCRAAEHAYRLGLGLNAGHDLNLHNLVLYRSLPHLQEVSIGHALTVDALQMGMANAVRAYGDTLNGRR